LTTQWELLLPFLAILFCGLDFIVTKASQRKNLAWQWPLNFGLHGAGLLFSLVVPFSVFTFSSLGIKLGIDFGQRIQSYNWLLGFALWLLVESLVAYIAHFAMHRFRPLWAFHRVHHSDENINASTAVRHHPLEGLIEIIAIAPVALVCTPSLQTLVATYVLTNAINFFNHSRVNLPLGLSHALEWVIVTPRLHYVHHSTYAPQTDSNFCGTLTIWDRVFGTYRSEVPAAIGLDDPTLQGHNARDFDTLLREPFRFLLRRP